MLDILKGCTYGGEEAATDRGIHVRRLSAEAMGLRDRTEARGHGLSGVDAERIHHRVSEGGGEARRAEEGARREGGREPGPPPAQADRVLRLGVRSHRDSA